MQVPDKHKTLSSGHQSQFSRKRPSYLPKLDKIPESVRQRIPDSDHLAKMRAFLVEAHNNDNFVKALTGDALIPTNLKLRLEQRKPQEEEFGESFM